MKTASPDPINESKAALWNKCITPRLESLRSWFNDSNWQEGLLPYLMSVLLQRREHLEQQGNKSEDDQFIKGQIAMLKQFASIPEVIRNQIEQIEAQKDQGPKGDAGY